MAEGQTVVEIKEGLLASVPQVPTEDVESNRLSSDHQCCLLVSMKANSQSIELLFWSMSR